MNKNASKVRKSNKKGSKGRKKSKKRLRISKRGLITIVVIPLISLMIILACVNSYLNRNSLDRVSSRLKDSLNESITDVQKSTKIELFKSASSDLLCNLQPFDYVTEPSSVVKVLDTTLPKWIVYVKVNKFGLTTQYTMYDFEVLSDNILGHSNGNHISIDTLLGLSEESLTSNIGFKPYIRRFMADGSKQLIFRYNYKDEKTNNSICMQLTFDLDASNLVIQATETKVDYLTDILLSAKESTSDIVIGTS